MPSHIVLPGETFASISSQVYGEPGGAALIDQANAAASEPLTAGTVLGIPARPGFTPPPPLELSAVDDPREVSVIIDGIKFDFWKEVSITRGIDTVDTISLSAPRADTKEFRELFRPLSYKAMRVTVGGTPLFTGTMLEPSPSVDTDGGDIVEVSGYSLPGVLEDSTAPPSMYPTQYKGMTLGQISRALCDPFSIVTLAEGEIGGPFKDRPRLKPGAKILDFLTDLAQQRKLLISSSPLGELLIRNPPEAGQPVATLKQGAEGPATAFRLTTNPQAFFSDITCVRRVGRSTNGTQHTVINPALRESGVLRPLVRTIDDVSSGELPAATEALAGRMLAGAVTASVTVGDWLDAVDGDLWLPGTTVSVEAPGAMIYSPYDFILREVRFHRKESVATASLSLVLPGAFSGVFPDVLPWDSV